jgi:hypothetical protein
MDMRFGTWDIRSVDLLEIGLGVVEYTITIYEIYMFFAAFAIVTVFVMYLTTCFGSEEPSSGEVKVYKCYRN